MPRFGICFVVHGRVQGVGFRWWTHREAERLGIGGTVRNRPDGGATFRVSLPVVLEEDGVL